MFHHPLSLLCHSGYGRLVEILKKLNNHGFEVYLAGGAVRDMLSGREPADVDVVTNARPGQILALFSDRKTVTAGKCFSVCLVDGIEIATYRTGFCHRPYDETAQIEFADTIHDDLKRRDFTINSMALCPFSGRLIDDFNGVDDLKRKIIRFTGEPSDRIREDPCRIIRACRFLAKQDAAFAPKTRIALCRFNDAVPARVAPERIRLEILKAIGCTKPSIFFRALHDIGVLKRILPSLNHCYGLDGGPHHDETVFDHSMIAGDSLPPNRPILRLAGFLHDVGKFETADRRNGRLSFIGHEKAIDNLLQELKALKFTNEECRRIHSLIGIHMRQIDAKTSPRAVRRLISALEKENVTYQDFLRLRIADRKGNLAKPDFTLSELKVKIDKFRTELHAETSSAFSIKDLAVSGHDIMRLLDVPPGPVVGQCLNTLLERVLDQPELNTYDQLKPLIADFVKNKEL